MNRARLALAYEMIVAGSTLLGGVVGSSTFAYDSHEHGPAAMFGSAVFGAAVGSIGGAIAGASSPVAIPGLLIGGALNLKDYGSKKLITQSNQFLAGTNGPTGQAPSSSAAAPPTAS